MLTILMASEGETSIDVPLTGRYVCCTFFFALFFGRGVYVKHFLHHSTLVTFFPLIASFVTKTSFTTPRLLYTVPGLTLKSQNYPSQCISVFRLYIKIKK